MTDFTYQNGELYAEDVALKTIAAAVGTPFFVYSAQGIQRQALSYMRAFSDQDAIICFAVKANSNPHLLKLIATYGLGADVVSGGELLQVLKVGIPASKIVFSGVGKTATELQLALKTGIYQINVESIEELRLLDEVARSMGVVANVALRVNPDVDAVTHHKITTGTLNNKFGIDWQDVEGLLIESSRFAGVRIVGLATHIGSQITSLEPYRLAYTRLAAMAVKAQEYGHHLKRLDLGGGIGIAYSEETILPDLHEYAAMVKEIFSPLGVKLIIEPGRSVIGAAGVLVSKVLYTKATRARQFVILDAGMNDLIRPAMYEARHRILPIQKGGKTKQPYTVVGPVCESSDVFGDYTLPPVAAGSLLALLDSGAYGTVMGSTYNLRLPAAEVLVAGGKYTVIRRRPSYEEMAQFYPSLQWVGS